MLVHLYEVSGHSLVLVNVLQSGPGFVRLLYRSNQDCSSAVSDRFVPSVSMTV